MNVKKSLLLTVSGLILINAHADLTIGDDGDFTRSAGTSGLSISTISANSSLTAGTTYNISTSVSSPGLLSDSFITDGGDTSVNSLYNPGYANSSGLLGALYVKFDVPPGTAPGDYPVDVTIMYTPQPSPPGVTVTQDYYFIVSVPSPEPSQSLAGVLILGGAGLVIFRRRILKK